MERKINRMTVPGRTIHWNHFDLLIIGYCLVTSLMILIFGRPLSEYYSELIFYISMASLAVLLVYFLDENKSKFNLFMRLFYPGFMFSFFYRETGGMMNLFFDSFYDYQIATFEKAILGFNPTLYIDKYLLNPLANEFFSMCYFIYYFLIIWFMFSTYFKKDYKILKSFINAMCITFFTSYWLFSLYPIEGPRWFFKGEYLNNIEGFIFRPAVEFIIGNAAVHGGCMPSSHFGISVVILMYCYKNYKKAAIILTPIVIGLAIGTFWGRFHYVSDVFVGGIIGLASVYIVNKFETTPDKFEYKNKLEEITV